VAKIRVEKNIAKIRIVINFSLTPNVEISGAKGVRWID
jgi:hypothetical protein